MGQLAGLTTEKTEKKKPIKAMPIDNKVGGIFSAKVVAIWQKMFGKKNG